jgi:zinc transport system permease protein
MRIVDFLSDPRMWQIYRPGVIAGVCTALMCGVLSPLVVVRRLGFIGQGISHCAFGGVGVAAALASFGLIVAGETAEFAVIAAFCIGAALGMGAIADRRKTPEDTTIGLFLVGSMAAGALLVAFARTHAIQSGRPADARSWESILFGSVAGAGDVEMALASGVLVVVAITAFVMRRPLLFWAFDDNAARAFGVPTGWMKSSLMVLLALVVVTAMKIAGVVLASALLVLPGAIALKLSERLAPVLALSVSSALLGLLGGLLLSVDRNWQPGPCVVLTLIALFAIAAGWSHMSQGRSSRSPSLAVGDKAAPNLPA